MKTLEIQCSEGILALLCEAIELYAHAAFPPGGSECAQASRESLLAVNEQLRQSHGQGEGKAGFNRRARGLVKAAIQYHGQRIAEHGEHSASHETAVLLGLLEGTPVSDPDLEEARRQDAG